MDHRKVIEEDGSAGTEMFCSRYEGLNLLEIEMFLYLKAIFHFRRREQNKG